MKIQDILGDLDSHNFFLLYMTNSSLNESCWMDDSLIFYCIQDACSFFISDFYKWVAMNSGHNTVCLVHKTTICLKSYVVRKDYCLIFLVYTYR